mgnify:CR=1 FL=1
MATIDMEQLDGVVGCFCTLLYPRRGQTEGTIVEDLGCEVIVQLINGKEVTEYKDDVVICEYQERVCWLCGLQTLSSFDCKNSFRTILQ